MRSFSTSPTTPLVIVPRLVIGAAVVLAAVLARRDAAHRPIAWALGGVLVGDLARAALELPPQVELALYLAAPALSAWCALRVLAGLGPWAAPAAPLAIWAAALWLAVAWPWFWPHAPLAAHVAAVVVQGAAAVSFWRSPRAAGVSETCALVLAGGDVLALAGPLGFPEAWAKLGWGGPSWRRRRASWGRCWYSCKGAL
ncbi:uncharacterized protein SOCE836_052950 [Sorangium cellulosum]|uniref:Uncharacterized protein n=1 Tax=Sorangium cellulosum TaxID=56 RepID=A0A4P2QT08_SORCE|nr:hypothetical protein [Sorangium cellulosum]AUX33141.1 uncharacterized protein SOCE836_052950 [Sorangium cellulosum]